MWSIETFEHEMKKFDPMLRLRESKIEPGVLFIERKAARETKCVPAPSDRQKIDVYRRNAEGHVLVCKAMKNELGKHLLLDLRAHDMWEHRGAGPFADALERQEREQREADDRAMSETLQAAGEEGYDKGMIAQGDVVSGFHQKA